MILWPNQGLVLTAASAGSLGAQGSKAAAAQDGDVGRAVDGGWSVFGLLEGGQLLIQSY